MAFHFPLATVLRVRESLEKKEQQALDQCYRHLYMVQKRLSETDARVKRLREEYADRLATGTKAAGAQCLIEEQLRVEQLRDTILKQLTQAQQALQEQLARFRAARQQREVITELRRSAYWEWSRHEAQREQRLVDDLYLLRRLHRK